LAEGVVPGHVQVRAVDDREVQRAFLESDDIVEVRVADIQSADAEADQSHRPELVRSPDLEGFDGEGTVALLRLFVGGGHFAIPGLRRFLPVETG